MPIFVFHVYMRIPQKHVQEWYEKRQRIKVVWFLISGEEETKAWRNHMSKGIKKHSWRNTVRLQGLCQVNIRLLHFISEGSNYLELYVLLLYFLPT